MPAGLTSRASIAYKDEARLLDGATDPDAVYINRVLPEKMKYNLEGIEKASFKEDLYVFGKNYFCGNEVGVIYVYHFLYICLQRGNVSS